MAGSYIFQRELGGSRGVGSSLPSAIWGHNPLAFERECSSDPALVRRLACMAELPTHASSMSNVSWSEHGDFMASGGEDCRIVVWSAEHQRAVHTLDVVSLLLDSSLPYNTCTSPRLHYIKYSKHHEVFYFPTVILD